MPCNRLVFILLIISLLTVIVNSKYGGPPDAVKMISVKGFGSFALIEFETFEEKYIKSFKIELHGVRNGKTITKTVEKYLGLFTFTESIDNLEPNETYIVRVFAINEHGQSPPSRDVILSQDEKNYSEEVSECKSPPLLPYKPHVEYMSGSRVNVTWEDLEKRRNRRCQGPIKFIIHYGDELVWNTKKTNETWIILDDLKKGIDYYLYVTAEQDNLKSEIPCSFPISLDEDRTGLPEPVITIESAFEKEVFTPGDPMTIKCSILIFPNSNMLQFDMELTVGERVVSLKNVESVTMYTIANEDVDTAKCKLSVRFKNYASRSSYRSWKVDKSLTDEYLRRRYEEIEADKEFMSFRKA